MPSNFIQRLHLLQNLPDVDLSKVKEFLFKVEEYIQRYTDEERICIDEYFCFVLGLNPGPHKTKYKDFYLVPTKEDCDYLMHGDNYKCYNLEWLSGILESNRCDDYCPDKYADFCISNKLLLRTPSIGAFRVICANVSEFRYVSKGLMVGTMGFSDKLREIVMGDAFAIKFIFENNHEYMTYGIYPGTIYLPGSIDFSIKSTPYMPPPPTKSSNSKSPSDDESSDYSDSDSEYDWDEPGSEEKGKRYTEIDDYCDEYDFVWSFSITAKESDIEGIANFIRYERSWNRYCE
ncbi:hypothetical protein DASB73_004670 [Starmerella bacillaris]|uniref:Uncharacterized protein n=1 Tax=Starmerella bacillaris TaxID=1247836 RepID=A0AAV5RD61_STABA|nr:hypothetical protein DASB73_004670 [Starmerella bacillaris]